MMMTMWNCIAIDINIAPMIVMMAMAIMTRNMITHYTSLHVILTQSHDGSVSDTNHTVVSNSIQICRLYAKPRPYFGAFGLTLKLNQSGPQKYIMDNHPIIYVYIHMCIYIYILYLFIYIIRISPQNPRKKTFLSRWYPWFHGPPRGHCGHCGQLDSRPRFSQGRPCPLRWLLKPVSWCWADAANFGDKCRWRERYPLIICYIAIETSHQKS